MGSSTSFHFSTMMKKNDWSRGTIRTGHWIEVYQEQIAEPEEDLKQGKGDAEAESNAELETKKGAKQKIKRVLTLAEIYAVHGHNVKPDDLTRLRLNGKKFTSLKQDEEWAQVKPITADLSINFMNLDDVELISSRLETLEMPFNGMSLLRLKSPTNYAKLTSIDLSWNYLSDPSIAILEQLNALEKINLAGNRLTLFPLSKNSFPRLKELRLQSNQLTENCFLNFLHLNELAELHLNQNLIKAIPLMITNERKIVMVNLQLLDLTGNPISEDTKLLPVASCPKLRTIIICRTGLARKHNGYPPLTKKYLVNRLGIQVIKDMAATKTKRKHEFRHSRKVDTTIPQIIRSTVDERIRHYREQIALEQGDGAPVNSAITDSPSKMAKREAMPDSSFFLTQDMDHYDESDDEEAELRDHLGNDIMAHETEADQSNSIMLMNDLSELTLTQKEQTEYNKTVRKIPMQTAYNQLQRMLRGDRSQSISIEKRRKERERDELKNALQYKRNRPVTKELDLEAVLAADAAVDTRNRQEVQAFFAKLKDGGKWLRSCLKKLKQNILNRSSVVSLTQT